ncbi:MAG TPA: RNA polymerase sigma-70 factor [Bacteroidales bacterium]|nr:RNA polymerase sigma-70 factor [Bacteroidales bacterium]
MDYSNQQLIDNVKKGEVAAFEALYEQYYLYLCLIAEHIVKNPADAEEIVSDVFIKLWNIRGKIEITTSLKAYLIRAVYNTSFNHLEKLRLRNKINYGFSSSDYALLVWDNNYPLGQLYEKEILDILDKGIKDLPEACRQIFLLSRNDDMKYSDIACKLDISVNTVKTQMKIALARLRNILKDYLVIILFFIGT